MVCTGDERATSYSTINVSVKQMPVTVAMPDRVLPWGWKMRGMLAVAIALIAFLGGCTHNRAKSDTPALGATTATQALPQPTARSATPTVSTAGTSNPSPQAQLAQTREAAIWQQLRQGQGYVVLLRHAQTVPGIGDPAGFRLADCTTQRNLSPAGRAQASRIGNSFRDRGIPVQRVLSSQYCRCLETARLLNLGPVEPAPALNSTFEDRASAAPQTRQVRQLIQAHRQTAGVIVMVSHMVNIDDISGVSLSSGAAVVVRANPQGELDIVGQLSIW
jgi:phosphohistidine phosphatase SixA